MNMLSSEAEVMILQRVLDADRGSFSEAVAKQLLKIGFEESDHTRMAALSAKSQEGTLSPAEQEELDGFINVSHLIAFIHSKARQSLKKPGSTSTAA